MAVISTFKTLDNLSYGEVRGDVSLLNQDFKKEKDLLGYIIDNIEKFAEDFLEDELISYEMEKPIIPQRKQFGPRRARGEQNIIYRLGIFSWIKKNI